MTCYIIYTNSTLVKQLLDFMLSMASQCVYANKVPMKC